MKKDVKEYIRYTMVGTIMIYVVVMFLFCLASFVWFEGILRIIFIVITLLIVINLFRTIKKYLYYKSNNKLDYYENVNKELVKPLLFEDNKYILTENYIINLKNGHIFKYDEIATIYEKIGFGGATYMGGSSYHILFNKYLYITTKNNDCDRYAIGQIVPIVIGSKYTDVSDLIKKKNPYVKEL